MQIPEHDVYVTIKCPDCEQISTIKLSDVTMSADCDYGGHFLGTATFELTCSHCKRGLSFDGSF